MLPKLDLPEPVGQEKYTKGPTAFKINITTTIVTRAVAEFLSGSEQCDSTTGQQLFQFLSLHLSDCSIWQERLISGPFSFYLHIIGKKYFVVRTFVTLAIIIPVDPKSIILGLGNLATTTL